MDAHSPQTQPHKTNTDTPPRRVTEVTWCGLCKVCLLADGAQVSRGRGDKHTTETQVSHPLALTTLTAGAHSAHTQDRFPPALCYTQEHSCLVPLRSRGQSQHTCSRRLPSPKVTHTQTHRSMQTPAQRPRTYTQIHTDKCMHMGAPEHAHTPLDSHIYRPSLQTGPANCDVTWHRAPAWRTHTAACPQPPCDLHKANARPFHGGCLAPLARESGGVGQGARGDARPAWGRWTPSDLLSSSLVARWPWFKLCFTMSQVTYPICASVSICGKWGLRTHLGTPECLACDI